MTAGPTADAPVGADELRRARARAQLLHRPPGHSPTTIVGHLLAVQAQDERSARLAVRARSAGLLATDVARALCPERRDLVTGWLGRGTLHMVCVEDYAWLLGLTAPARLTQSSRRLAQEGLSPAQVERGVKVIERSLTDNGPLTRGELADRLERASVPAAGQAIVHLIMLSALRGIAIPATTPADHQTVALTDDWLGSRPAAKLSGDARDAALAELARRYLKGHGPARDRDLARWAGLGLRDARRGLASLGGRLVELGGGIIALFPHEPSDTPLPPTLIPSFDPYMLGWEDRGFAVRPEHRRLVHPGGGMLRAVACLDGLAIGTWSARRSGDGLSVTVDPFAGLDADVERALAADAADLARFEGGATQAAAGMCRWSTARGAQ